MSTIPLAKPFNRTALEKMGGAYGVSVKLDGVPLKFVFDVNGSDVKVVDIRTRQDKPCPAGQVHAALLAMSIKEGAGSPMAWPDGRYTFVAEVTHPLKHDFKDLSGIVRSEQHEEHRQLIFNVFDFVHDIRSGDPYAERMFAANMLFSRSCIYDRFRVVEQSWYSEVDDAIAHAEQIASIEVVEGAIIKSGRDVWAPGKRSWGYQKVLVDPTVDLRVVGFEEAVSGKTGEPLGMVGRINCEYRGETIGVGPGKLSHTERKKVWYSYMDNPGLPDYGIAEVKYKRDESYTALRQPTFQQWRDDKTEPNEDTE